MGQQLYADIHTHILPGVDDGSPDMSTSLEMLRLESEQGVGTVFLTPHFKSGQSRYTKEGLLEGFEALRSQEAVKEMGLDLYLGNECFYSRTLLDDLDRGAALTMGGGRSVLVEFPINEAPKKIIEGCRYLYNGGYSIILAHIERYYLLDAASIDALMDMDVRLQMNASFVRKMCQPVLGKKRIYKQLLKEGAVSFIATDAHDTAQRRPELFAREIKRAFPEYAKDMLRANAEALSTR